MIRTILVPTDFSESADSALEHAFFHARLHDAQVHLLHVVERPFVTVPELPDEIFQMAADHARESVRILLRRHERTLNDLMVTVVPQKSSHTIAEEVVAFAVDNRCDMIVMGTHGRRGPRRLLLGSVTEDVLRHAGIPVLTVRQDESLVMDDGNRHILVPLDLGDGTDPAIRMATDLALKMNARLELLHVVDVGFFPYYGILEDPVLALEEKAMKHAGAMLLQRADAIRSVGIDVEIHRRKGPVADRILNFISENELDLVVMASHGRDGLDRVLLGSITERVLRGAHVPVLVAPVSDHQGRAGARHAGEEALQLDQ